MLYNEALIRISGIPKDIIGETSLHDRIKNNHHQNVAAAIKALETKKPATIIVDYYNGKKALVTATPFFDENQEVLFVVSNIRDITEINQLQRELEETRQMNSTFLETINQLREEYDSNNQIVYRSKHMHHIMSLAFRFSKNNAPILLLGESGVGKDVLANYIHEQSQMDGHLIKVNCGSIPEHLLESELFGYEKGAFTGAIKSKEGLFELAHKGTIFLDEIGDLPFSLQVKLLTVLQDFTIRRVGGTNTRKIDVRVIAATNSDLKALVDHKKFRLDLFYRLNVLSITIPPLRERPEDIPALLFHQIQKLEKKYKKEIQIDNLVIEKLIKYDWPGNIRELNNVVERIYHMSDGRKITLDQIPPSITEHKKIPLKKSNVISQGEIKPLKDAVHNFEREYITNLLHRTATMQECANILDVNISTLVRKKSSLGIT